MKRRIRPENVFCEDVCELLSEKLQLQELGYDAKTGIKILKDVMVTKESAENYYIQFNFFEQDIVICRDMDKITKPKDKQIKFHRSDRSNEIVIPRVIIEGKLGVGSHALITYSKIAEDIKKIFPFVKYFLLIRSTEKREELLRRHGQNFDDIFKLENKRWGKRKYKKGDLKKDIESNKEVRQNFEHFLREVEEVLKRNLSNSVSRC